MEWQKLTKGGQLHQIESLRVKLIVIEIWEGFLKARGSSRVLSKVITFFYCGFSKRIWREVILESSLLGWIF
jgi:hypothetical protein